MLDLTQLGTYLRCPGGQVETIPQQQAAGVKWAALNIGTDACANTPGAWIYQRQLYYNAGIPFFPWRHCRSLADVNDLILTASAWKSPAIGLNIEDVVNDKLDLSVLGPYVQSKWSGPVHMATLPWVQNQQGWSHMYFAVAALEMFPEVDPRYLADWQGCVDHAFSEGLTKVTLLYSTQSPRSVYPNVAHMLYTADNVTSWPEWKDSVPQPVPQPPGGVPVPPYPTIPISELIYPHPKVKARPPRSDLHPTAGLAHNWALDFMAPGGTKVYAPDKGVIWKLSGNDPAKGVIGGDIFGWNIYLMTSDGVIYFGTHFGDVLVTLGQRVKPGKLIAHVGHWPNDPGRSHTHLGVTHPGGAAAAKARIVKVSKAKQLP